MGTVCQTDAVAIGALPLVSWGLALVRTAPCFLLPFISQPS